MNYSAVLLTLVQNVRLDVTSPYPEVFAYGGHKDHHPAARCGEQDTVHTYKPNGVKLDLATAGSLRVIQCHSWEKSGIRPRQSFNQRPNTPDDSQPYFRLNYQSQAGRLTSC